MSLIDEVLADTRSVVNEILGHPCLLINTVTSETTPVTVIIRSEVELYQNNMLVGIVTTGVFDLGECSPLVGNELDDTKTGISYSLDGIKAETGTKIEYILGQLS